MDKIRWNAPEYLERERSIDWFWGLGLGAVVIAIVSFYFHNYLFAILIIISAFSLAIFAVRKPHDVEYELSEDGLRIGNLLYPFNPLDSFWVERIAETAKIILASKK